MPVADQIEVTVCMAVIDWEIGMQWLEIVADMEIDFCLVECCSDMQMIGYCDYMVVDSFSLYSTKSC